MRGASGRRSSIRGWLAEAGFVDVQVVDLERSHNQLVLGRRPADA